MTDRPLPSRRATVASTDQITPPVTRRTFLRGATTAAATAALVSATGRALAQEATGASPAAVPTTQGSLNVAAVGCDGMGWGNIRGVSRADGVNIVALCDIDERHMDRPGERFPGARKWTDFRKMLDEQKDIDAVIVSTPDHTHANAALMSMRLGKHVYCEKPLTHNIAEARLLTEEARKHGIATQMGNRGHSSEGNIRQVEWVRSGVIGPVREVHVWTDRPIWPQGIDRPEDTPACPSHINWDGWLGPAPERPYHPAYHPFNWRGFWDFGTGALGDMACHVMDTPYWALNLTNPASVEAFSAGATAESAPHWSVIRYEFPALGDRPAVTVFWYDGGLRPPVTLSRSAEQVRRLDNGILFVGQRGSIWADMNSEPQFTDPEMANEITPPEPSIERPAGHYEQWVNACRGGPAATSHFDYAGPLSEMVLLGNLAIRTGQRVEWDHQAMRCTNLPAANQYVSREYRKGWEL